MSFVSRAERARARGDETRALMVLIEGMKREPGMGEAIDLLVRWYSVERPLLGIEEDVARVVMTQPNPDDLLSTIYDNLRVNQNEALASSLLEHGMRLGLTYVPAAEPSAEVSAEEPPIPEDEEPPARHEVDAFRVEPDVIPPAFEEVPSEVENENQSESAATQRRPSPPVELRSQSRSKRGSVEFSRRYALAAAVIVIGLSLLWWGLNNGKRVAAIRTLDAALETIDPLSGQQLIALVESLERTYPDDPEILERAFFARVEMGAIEDSAELETPSTMWGVGALAISSIERGDIEGGIRHVTHLDRAFPGTIPAFWGRVRLAELRGHEREMVEALSELNRKYPEFLPGWIAKLRLDLRRMDREGMAVSKQRIEALVPEHPYASIPEEVFPSPELVAGGILTIPIPSKGGVVWSDQSDEFLKSVSELNSAVLALIDRDYPKASEAIARALATEPKFGPALFVSGMVRVRVHDLDGISSLRLIAQIEGASDELVQMTQAFGTVALSSMGRVDDAGYFLPVTSSEDGIGLQEGAFRRFIPEEATVYGAIATYGRELVEYERGIIPRLSEPSLTQDGRDRGAWDDVLKVYGELTEGKAVHVGDAVLAHLALGHVEEGAAELEQPTSILGDILLDGPRVLVGAWRNPTNQEQVESLERLLSLDPGGVTLPIWVADALIWQGDFSRAEETLTKVLKVQEDNPRANWLLGIVLRHRGEFRQSDHQFNKARPVLDVNGLIELGERFAMTQNHDESRKMYHKAVMQDRSNLRALRGLGRSYAELDSETAVRDLDRIAQSYHGSEWVAQRAEALKWLGVSMGTRVGNSAGLIPLEQAEKLVGKRADILVEQAHYHEAIGDELTARQLYGQALQSNSTLGDAHLGLGRTALRAKDVRIARDHLRKYLELVPRGRHRSWAEEKLSALE